jgi:hypothetical protein
VACFPAVIVAVILVRFDAADTLRLALASTLVVAGALAFCAYQQRSGRNAPSPGIGRSMAQISQ